MRTLDLFEIWQCVQRILPTDNNSIYYGCLHFSLKDLVVNCLKLCQAVKGWDRIFHLKKRAIWIPHFLYAKRSRGLWEK